MTTTLLPVVELRHVSEFKRDSKIVQKRDRNDLFSQRTVVFSYITYSAYDSKRDVEEFSTFDGITFYSAGKKYSKKRLMQMYPSVHKSISWRFSEPQGFGEVVKRLEARKKILDAIQVFAPKRSDAIAILDCLKEGKPIAARSTLPALSDDEYVDLIFKNAPQELLELHSLLGRQKMFSIKCYSEFIGKTFEPVVVHHCISGN